MYLNNAHSNHNQETGQWAWNPVDWFGEGSNTTIIAGVNTNTDFSSVGGYAGAGTGYHIPAVSYNSSYGPGVGYWSPQGSSFTYPGYNPPSANEVVNNKLDQVRQEHGAAWMETSLGAAASIGSEMFYSKTYGTWMGKNFKMYQQTWGGNRFTGGKNKFGKSTSNAIKWGGRLVGAYSGYKTIEQRINGEIGTGWMSAELGTTGVSTFGGLYGAAWGVGWELGRAVTTLDAYQEFKFNFWYNRWESQVGPPSQSNEGAWYYFYQNYGR